MRASSRVTKDSIPVSGRVYLASLSIQISLSENAIMEFLPLVDAPTLTESLPRLHEASSHSLLCDMGITQSGLMSLSGLVYAGAKLFLRGDVSPHYLLICVRGNALRVFSTP
ncbi:hypothetical protein CEXT_294931 [Caerostris extrusa]|uniref:Uncharacterized protein n=1 Tax=Caerostris extrusa TaxID=172846 RepID=A0AAV4RR62_CAEEX|nr:hypothetical protein CEXT_294931 [Caerostris extrusa]